MNITVFDNMPHPWHANGPRNCTYVELLSDWPVAERREQELTNFIDGYFDAGYTLWIRGCCGLTKLPNAIMFKENHPLSADVRATDAGPHPTESLSGTYAIV